MIADQWLQQQATPFTLRYPDNIITARAHTHTHAQGKREDLRLCRTEDAAFPTEGKIGIVEIKTFVPEEEEEKKKTFTNSCKYETYISQVA